MFFAAYHTAALSSTSLATVLNLADSDVMPRYALYAWAVFVSGVVFTAPLAPLLWTAHVGKQAAVGCCRPRALAALRSCAVAMNRALAVATLSPWVILWRSGVLTRSGWIPRLRWTAALVMDGVVFSVVMGVLPVVGAFRC